jgi:lipopolysaccharide transport system ATP-binding protein
MNDIVIKAENLGKLYRIGSAEDRDKSFREALSDMALAPFRRIINAFSPPVLNELDKSYFVWALKDVSFEVKRGEVLGIIGRNGAGKSTLLKILSRITEPTEGRVTLQGRVGSLLEVGTGFHSELTGKENIYLSGTILGMNSNEISRKFDEIVDFAEVEKFIHTPVKYYSSGMYMRLAFAVAAHLEPDILLIDEVLAVGDAQFQKKCLGKMSNISKEGRTIIYVSHQLDTIKRLCISCILLSNGRLIEYGNSSQTVEKYLGYSKVLGFQWINPTPDKTKKGYLESIILLKKDGNPSRIFPRDEEIIINMIATLREKDLNFVFRCDLIREETIVLRTSDFDMIYSGNETGWQSGSYSIRIVIPPNILNYGTYSVRPHFGIFDVESIFFPPEPLITFEVIKENKCNNFVSRLNLSNHPGSVYPDLVWKIRNRRKNND